MHSAGDAREQTLNVMVRPGCGDKCTSVWHNTIMQGNAGTAVSNDDPTNSSTQYPAYAPARQFMVQCKPQLHCWLHSAICTNMLCAV